MADELSPQNSVQCDSSELTSWKLPPLRPLSDFLSHSARFQWPDYQTRGKWGKRIRSNLLYYEGNYLLSAIIFLAVAAILWPDLWVAVLVVLGGYTLHGLTFGSLVLELRKTIPEVHLAAVIVTSKLVIDYFSYLYILLAVVLAIVILVLVHASLRMRNIQNKLLSFKQKLDNVDISKSLLSAVLRRIDVIIEESNRGALIGRDAYIARANQDADGVGTSLGPQT